jgi:hypothetical protein
MPKSPIHQCEHAMGEVVFVKKILTIDLPLQEGVEI